MIMATSHVDLHGDILSHKALESLVDQIKSQYLPINVNHDIKGHPIGRLISAEIIKLPDAFELLSEYRSTVFQIPVYF